MREIDGALNFRDGGGVGRVQDKEMPPSRRRERQGKYFSRETRTAHAQQYDVTQAGLSDLARAILDCGRFGAHGIEHTNPAEPVRYDPGMAGIILPKAGLPGPHFLNRLAGSK